MRLIDADDLLTAFPIGDEPTVTIACIRATIKHMPTIEERKTGEWIRKISVVDCATFVGDECSQCGYYKSLGQANFCPNCGAEQT